MKRRNKVLSLFLTTMLTLSIIMPMAMTKSNAENAISFSNELSKSSTVSTKIYVKVSKANMRKSNSTSSKLVTTLKKGEEGKLIYIVSNNKYLTNAWAYVNFNGDKGYVSLKYLQINKYTIGDKNGVTISKFKSKLSSLGFRYYSDKTYIYKDNYSIYAAGVCTFPNSESVAIGYGGNYKSSKFTSTLKKSLKLLVPTKADTIYKKFKNTNSKTKYIGYISDGRMAVIGKDKVNSVNVKLVVVSDIN